MKAVDINTDKIRNSVIDKLLSVRNVDFLKALDKMIESAHVQEDTIALSEEQRLMLMMSDDDIKEGRTIDQEALNQEELEWLKEK